MFIDVTYCLGTENAEWDSALAKMVQLNLRQVNPSDIHVRH